MTASSGTILIVDDEPSVCDVVAALSETLGYGALRAQTGAAALEILGAQPVAAVLLDVMMPDMSGPALAAAMRQRGIDPPIVVMTGMMTDAVQDLVDQDPARRVALAKPFLRKDLKSALDTVLASGNLTL